MHLLFFGRALTSFFLIFFQLADSDSSPFYPFQCFNEALGISFSSSPQFSPKAFDHPSQFLIPKDLLDKMRKGELLVSSLELEASNSHHTSFLQPSTAISGDNHEVESQLRARPSANSRRSQIEDWSEDEISMVKTKNK